MLNVAYGTKALGRACTGELAKCEVLSVVPENIRPVALDYIFVQLRKYNYRAMQPAA